MASNAFQLDTDIGAVWKREVDKLNLEHPDCFISSSESWSVGNMDSVADNVVAPLRGWTGAVGCLKALMDDVADNNVPSLQVLAKVLRLVPRLEEEAAIVASSQFYVPDHELATKKTSSIIVCTNTLLCAACFEEVRQRQATDRRWYPCRSGHQGIHLPAPQLKGIGERKMFLG
ncbi:hypothetical protein B0H66DRAFT_544795 [Apodospora peruviana]|uniref:Uncharacterized protein n=1 Tax=Apodospora peruviana TaxID=516989 RepID=A0AAE0IT30_9PEZI|nr:hypothetical protein B0H66DRAFT_544795 [Apodospora peruviana]